MKLLGKYVTAVTKPITIVSIRKYFKSGIEGFLRNVIVSYPISVMRAGIPTYIFICAKGPKRSATRSAVA